MICAVFGHSGLVGTNLCSVLLKKGHKVFGISRTNKNPVKGVKSFQVDLRYKEQVAFFMNKIKPDVVYCLSANSSEARGQISPIDMTERNLLIFVNVLTAAINCKVKRFIYTSSVAVYGEAGTPYKETGPLIPKDVYGVNKLAAEQILKILAKVYKFEYTIFRPHNIYGPGQNMNDPTKNAVALFMRRIMENQPYMLFGEGKMMRAFSYVDDVVDVFVEALGPKFANQTLNVGAEESISIKTLSDMIQDVMGKKGIVEMKPARPQEIFLFLADHENQNKLTKYKATPLKEGLTKTWKWAKKKGIQQLEIHPNEIV